jgi:hypothetical protein
MSRTVRGSALALALAIVALGALACGQAATPVADGTTVDFEVIVRDGAIRTSGAECSGASPYLHVRAGVPWRIEDPEGRTLASGSLPAGEAINAFEEDLEVPRVPTFCRMRWELTLPPADGYMFMLEEGTPVTFDLDSLDDERRITVIIR